MRLIPLVLLCSMPFAVAQSQPAIPPNPAGEAKKIRLEGRVLSTSGEPVRKATVRLMGGAAAQPGQQPSNFTESSDNEGKFLFDDLTSGRYSLQAEKAGFVTGRYGARSITSPGTSLNVSAGQELKDLVIMLTPQGVITGRVTDADGDPLRGVQIMVLRSGYNQGKRQLMPTGAASSDDQGNFRASNLAPGRYYLSAVDRSSYSGMNDRPGKAGAQPAETNVTTYYPNVTEVASASPIDVTAGAELSGFGIQLRKGKAFAIRGKAVDASGAPAQSAMLTAIPKPEPGANTLAMMIGRNVQQGRPDGAFEFRGLTPGTYIVQSLLVSNNGAATQSLAGRAEVTITDSSVEGVVLALGSGAAIDGSLRLEGGDIKTLVASPNPASSRIGTVAVAASAAGAVISPLGIRSRVTLQEADMIGIPTPNAQVNDDGTFKVQGVSPGKYYVNFLPLPEGSYIKAIRFGNQDVTGSPIDLTSGSGGALEILLSNKPADLSGILRDAKGEPLGGVPVTLWPKEMDRGTRPSAIKSSSTDQTGSFKISGLAPGEYFAAAWDDPEPGLTQSPEFLARFTNEAAAVKLAESAHATVEVKLIPREKILAEVAKLP